MRLDELPRSDKVEDRRGDGSGGFPMGRAGGMGIGTVILLGLVGWALGINPLYLIGGAEILSGMGGSQQQQSQSAPDNAKTESPSDQMGEFVSAVLGSTEVQWKEIFARAGKTYQLPTLVMFSGATRSACGFAQSAMGPFYNTARMIRRFISTPHSFRISNAVSVAATRKAGVANSPRPTLSPARLATTCRTCSESCRGCRRRNAAWRRSRPINSNAGRVAGRLPRRGVGTQRGGKVAVHRARRCRIGHADGGRHRR